MPNGTLAEGVVKPPRRSSFVPVSVAGTCPVPISGSTNWVSAMSVRGAGNGSSLLIAKGSSCFCSSGLS
ncbi:hypothetical protein N8E89_03320 [Phyllobacterium sp. A18/5-2]|uniref:hypothetical protein n=1 Tax=Phyllobacterium sp. A18/5-2 TaxID=2978392 RepID=UPI0021C96DAA|nr:hypothetical protein [Phyllobacterium sp. A18/5-2]UXN64851.1 hypothetical protein N8E89_03320 [Phyllobacterium sp. A18/5-2]